MKINCGFCRKIKKNFQHKNIQGIEINNLTWEDDHKLIREQLIKYAPEGMGWYISGYALVVDKEMYLGKFEQDKV